MTGDDPVDGPKPEPKDEAANQLAALAQPRPTWATVIGTISIVLGVQALLGCLPMVRVTWSLMRVSVSVGGSLGGLTVGRWIATLVLHLAIALLLLTAGIALVRRRRAALLHILAGVLGLVAVIFTVLIVSAVMETTSSVGMLWVQAKHTWTFRASLAVTVLVQSAYPGFLLFWFLRPAICRQVLSWAPPPSEEPAPPPAAETPEPIDLETRVPSRNIPEPPPASWPKVIGICSIAVSALTALTWALPGTWGQMGEAGCVDLPLAAVLAAVGICLLLHRPAAMAHLPYALFRLLWCVWLILGQELSGLLLLRVGVDAAYAVFLLVWFARKATRLRIEYWAQCRSKAQHAPTRARSGVS